MVSLLLIRHEDAQPAFNIPDAHRGLTGYGRERMRATAALVAEQEGALDVIFTSPLVRAVQTAELLAMGLSHDEPIFARAVVAEPSGVTDFLGVLDEVPKAKKVAIVGHEPTMSYMAEHILELERFPYSFKKGTVCAIDLATKSFRYLIFGDGPQLITEL